MSRLVIMGSGETAPTMVPVHREIFANTPPGPAVMLDTTFGFQLNADDLMARSRRYFSDSVGKNVEPAPWRRRNEPALQREKTLALLARATWAFAGPGSPTYALRQWVDTPVPGALAELVRRGGTLIMGSAAAVTLGVCAVPVYEIYKAGADPYLADALDLLGSLAAIRALVIPHYDNAEGGTHDTRYCYLGEERLAMLEAELPAGVGVLGVDEHTALVIDLEARTATVAGTRLVTVRRHGESRRFEAGTVISLDDLAAVVHGEQALAAQAVSAAPTPRASAATPTASTSLDGATKEARTRFEAAEQQRDVDGCVGAILDLEAAIDAWSADTLQSTGTDDARRTLRSFVVRLGALAEQGVRDPREILAPHVESLLSLRAKARSAGDFATSDEIRANLVAAGIDVRDTGDGVEWVVT